MAPQKKEMSFLDHLEELRWHLVRIFIAILIVAIAVFFFKDYVYQDFLLAHINPDFITYKGLCQISKLFSDHPDICTPKFPDTLQAIEPMAEIMNLIWVSLILGFILAFPYIMYEIWRFVSPGLHKNERKGSRGFIFVSSFLFFTGVVFSFFMIAPLTAYFVYHFEITGVIEKNFSFNSYISMITNLLLGISLVFELPILVYYLTKMGLITPEFLKKYRKYSLVIVLIFSAFITPPDVTSQIIVAIPILILYEISIAVSKKVIKKQKKKEKQNG
jgi:sec-independent protein translocase protein TatC